MNRLLAALIAAAAVAFSMEAQQQWTTGQYVYDGSGNVVRAGTDEYKYDQVGRIVRATAGAQQLQSTAFQSYGYDAFGNRISISRCPSASSCAISELSVAPSTNHLTGGFTYDDRGALRDRTDGGAPHHYGYDSGGAMLTQTSEAATQEYIYTADDERIAAGSGGQWSWTIRDLKDQIARSMKSANDFGVWTIEADHVHSSQRALGDKTVAGRRHTHADHLGTPRVITDDMNRQLGMHAYFPFGEALALASEQPRERRQFAGQERDDAIGGQTLDYIHARYYDSALARFISFDPARPPINPSAWNRYSYALNSPLKYTDPDGRDIYLDVAPDQRVKVMWALQAKTGLKLSVNSSGKLELGGSVSGITSGSATARAALLYFMSPLAGEYHLRPSNDVWMAARAGKHVMLNFQDIAQINPGNNDARTLDLGMIILHELLGHPLFGEDYPGQDIDASGRGAYDMKRQHPHWKGPVVEWDNKVRGELRLEPRMQYWTEQMQSGAYYIPFSAGPVILPPKHEGNH